MAFCNWTPSYSVGVRRCDDEHQKLFQLINLLHEAMASGKGGAVVQEVVKQLRDYTRSHFTAEEALLRRTNYPELSAHCALHKSFVDRIVRFEENLKRSSAGQSTLVLSFLRDWLTKHIMQVDQKYSAHLTSHGIH